MKNLYYKDYRNDLKFHIKHKSAKGRVKEDELHSSELKV